MDILSTLILRRNVSLAPNQHIRMISEWSCDTKDCSKLLKIHQI